MTFFLSPKPEIQFFLTQLSLLLTQCQLGGMEIHVANLYNNGAKKPIIILNGVKIKENEDKTNTVH